MTGADSLPEASCFPDDDVGLEEVQGEWELDDLVNDLHKEWSQHERKKDVSLNSQHPSPKNNIVEGCNSEFFEVQLSPVLQPVAIPKTDVVQCASIHNLNQAARTSAASTKGPWSLDWMPQQTPISEGGVVFSSTCDDRKPKQAEHVNDKYVSSPGTVRSKKKQVNAVHNLVGFMKKIARMSAKDRNQILKILKKQKRIRKVKTVKASSKATTDSTTVSTKNSSSSVDNDWVNWVHLHGEPKSVSEDVKELGKVVGVKYQCDTSNTFNLLSREGRRLWRAVGGSETTDDVAGGEKVE